MRHRYFQLLLEEGDLGKIFRDTDFEHDSIALKVFMAARYFKLGKRKEAEDICNYLKEINIRNCNYWIAFSHAYGDDTEGVCSWLEKSFAAKEEILTYMKVEPAFKNYRNEPRIKNLLKKMRFPDI